MRPVTGTFHESLLWGHSGLLRRPRDDRWEKRTDVFHRRARSVLPELPVLDFPAALVELVRAYLRAYGPATRHDVGYFLGAGLRAVDQAVRTLGDEVEHLVGPDGEDHLDLAGLADVTATADPGVRLLPEFDGLLVGYTLPRRTRFISAAGLARVWSAANGQFSPIVLADGRAVGTWRTVTAGRRTDVEVEMLAGRRPLPEDELSGPVADAARALDLQVRDIRVRTG